MIPKHLIEEGLFLSDSALFIYRVICLSMTNDQKASGLGTPGKEPQIVSMFS